MIQKEQIVAHIMRMKTGSESTTPQPDCARAALEYYNKLFPDWQLNQAVAKAMKESEK